MKKIILTSLIAFSSISASAENLNEGDSSIHLHLGGFSYHFSDRANGQNYNENHKNIGLEYESKFNYLDEYLKGSDYFAGDYYFSFLGQYLDNSLGNDSALLAVGLKRKWNLDYEENWKFGLGFVAGFQSGYPKQSKGRSKDEFVPVAYPLAEISYKNFTVYGSIVPKIHTSGFAIVGFKYKLFDL